VLYSGGNANIIGNYGAGFAGEAASLPQSLANFLAYPVKLMAEDEFVPMGDYFSAGGTRSAVQRAVYASADPNSFITAAGGVGADVAVPYAAGRAGSAIAAM